MNRPTFITALALASLVALTGCVGQAQEPTGGSPADSSSGVASASAPAPGAGVSAEHDDADVMFAQMMIPHHEQAVTMSETLLAKDGVPAEVRELAGGVIAAQGPEIERMQQMLGAWGEPTSMEAEGMEGMDHGSADHGSTGSGAGMVGMMSDEDTTALQEAQGVEATPMYLRQMTVHHEGAIEMARDQVEQGQNPQAIELAQQVIEDQETEIAEMERMLRELSAGS